MKKILLFSMILLCFLNYAQDFKKELESDSITLFTLVKPDALFYESYDSKNCIGDKAKFIPQNNERSTLFFYDVVPCNDKYFIRGFFEKNLVYIPVGKSDNTRFSLNGIISNDLSGLSSAIQNLQQDQFQKNLNFASYNSTLIMESDRDNLFDYIKGFKKYSIAIVNARPTENYSMTGADFEIINFSKKTIKYITFNFYGINTVGDKVSRAGTYNLSRKGIGPIEYLETGKWSWDTIWLTDIVDRLKLVSANIIYMDGTSKVINITRSMWIDEDKLDEFHHLSDALKKQE
ncbi:hypothetical protein [Elizabethkingia bruuniana]|uniref:hypothetical protein n=1 Tax=Elizabethkingia bruuniana TaxID=1756149 RepID=UPI00398C7E80